jgi:MFS family permease
MTSTMTMEAVELQPLPSIPAPSSAGSKDNIERINRLSKDSDAIISRNIAADAPSATTPDGRTMSNFQLVMTILQPSIVNFFGSFTSGVITVGLPVIASSISLQRSLYLWPSSVYSLTSGAGLLIAGSVADIVGARYVELCGKFFLGLFILLCGFSQTGVQLVVFRAFQGIALAMYIPSSVSIISTAVPAGRARNIGFSCLGLSQPLGFSFGMVLSGIMIEKIGWRSGFYLCGGAILTAAATSWWTLPVVKPEDGGLTKDELWRKLRRKVDWVGGSIAGGGLALLSYVFA